MSPIDPNGGLGQAADLHLAGAIFDLDIKTVMGGTARDCFARQPNRAFLSAKLGGGFVHSRVRRLSCCAIARNGFRLFTAAALGGDRHGGRDEGATIASAAPY